MQALFTVARFTRRTSDTFSRTVFLALFAGGTLLLPAKPASALPPLEAIAFSGTQAPGLTSGINFWVLDSIYFQDGSGPTIGPNGEVTFYGTIFPTSSQTPITGIWEHDASGLNLVAIPQDHAAGFARGVNYTLVSGSSTIEPLQAAPVPLPIVDGSGNIAYSGFVQGLGIGSGNDEVLWDGPRGQATIVAQEGNAAPGAPSGTTFKSDPNYAFASYAMNAAGNVAFASGASGSLRYGIWEGSVGNLTPVVQTGDTAPGISGGHFQAYSPGVFPAILGPAVNASGDVAFEFSVAQPNELSLHDAVWVGTQGSLSLVARAGGPAPGTGTGVTFADPNHVTFNDPVFTFSRPEISSDDQVAFAGLLTGTGVTSANGTGIWAGSANNLQLVARAGDQAPGLAKGEIFGKLYSTSVTTTPVYMNANGKIVFAAPYTHANASSIDGYGVWTGNAGHLTFLGHVSSMPSIAINGAGQVAYIDSAGIWITDSSGQPNLVVNSNELVTGSKGYQTTISSFQFASGSTSDGFGTSFNDAGQFVFQAQLNDNTTGIFTVDLPPLFVPEPDTIALMISAAGSLMLRTAVKRFRLARALAALAMTLVMASGVLAATPVETIAVTATHAPDVPVGITFSAFEATTSGFSQYVTSPVPPSINASGQVAFYGYLAGGGVTTTNSVGIWTGKSGDVRLTALESDNVAGLGAAVNFLSFDPSTNGAPTLQPPVPLNAAAQVAVSADLSGIGISVLNDEVVWSGSSSGPNQFVQESPTGFHSSSTLTPTFGNAPFLNDAGDVGFTTYSTLSGTSGLWLDHAGSIQAIAQEGKQAPGMATGVQFSASTYQPTLMPSAMNASGSVAFGGVLAGPGITVSNQTGIWAGTPGHVQLIARQDDVAPGIQTPGGNIFFTMIGSNPFSSVDINAAGTVAFSAWVFTSSGVWTGDATGLHLVAADGQQAPGLAAGVTFRSQADLTRTPLAPLINSQGDVAFQSNLYGIGITSANNTAIFAGLPGSLQPIAQTGAQAPGAPAGTSFALLGSLTNPDFGINSLGQVAFTSQLSDGTFGIWGTDLAGHLREVVRGGDVLQVAPGDNRTVSSVEFLGGSGNSDGRASGLSDNGQVAFWASFTDGSSGIFVSDALTVPEPATLPLAAMALMVAAGLRWRSRSRG